MINICFLWSLLAHINPCENSHPSRVTNCIRYKKELNFERFDFTNGFKCSDVHKFEKLDNSSKSTKFDINFYQDQNNWKHN